IGSPGKYDWVVSALKRARCSSAWGRVWNARAPGACRSLALSEHTLCLLRSMLGFHGCDQVFCTCSPPRDRRERLGEGDVQGMHAVPAEDIDSSGERRGYRGHEHREAPVRQFFNNERGDEGLLNFG